ncbi:hypothetical protein MNBD_CHLOROFLEXI01-2844, partial [hydrothermal vent metagenome]
MSKETVANHVAKFLQKWGILLVLAVALLLQFIYL